MVAGRKDARVSLLARRRIASLFALDGRRRSASADETLDRRGHREVVAGRKDDCVYFFRLSRLQRRRLQQQARRRKGKEQSEGTRGGASSLPPLDALERRQEEPFVCGSHGWKRGATRPHAGSQL